MGNNRACYDAAVGRLGEPDFTYTNGEIGSRRWPMPRGYRLYIQFSWPVGYVRLEHDDRRAPGQFSREVKTPGEVLEQIENAIAAAGGEPPHPQPLS